MKNALKIIFGKMIFRKFENLLKSISDDAQTYSKGHPSNLGKGQQKNKIVIKHSLNPQITFRITLKIVENS